MKLLKFLQRPKKPRLFLLRQVMGDSMAPTLVPGTVVVGVRPRRINPGDVVVVRHNEVDKIKRVKEVQSDKVFLTGDNSLHSTDSRDFGWLEAHSVIAKVVWPKLQPLAAD